MLIDKIEQEGANAEAEVERLFSGEKDVAENTPTEENVKTETVPESDEVEDSNIDLLVGEEHQDPPKEEPKSEVDITAEEEAAEEEEPQEDEKTSLLNPEKENDPTYLKNKALTVMGINRVQTEELKKAKDDYKELKSQFEEFRVSQSQQPSQLNTSDSLSNQNKLSDHTEITESDLIREYGKTVVDEYDSDMLKLMYSKNSSLRQEIESIKTMNENSLSESKKFLFWNNIYSRVPEAKDLNNTGTAFDAWLQQPLGYGMTRGEAYAKACAGEDTNTVTKFFNDFLGKDKVESKKSPKHTETVTPKTIKEQQVQTQTKYLSQQKINTFYQNVMDGKIVDKNGRVDNKKIDEVEQQIRDAVKNNRVR